MPPARPRHDPHRQSPATASAWRQVYRIAAAFGLPRTMGLGFGKMARREMACPRMLQQRGLLARADALRLEASAPECAAAGRLERVRQVAFPDDALAGRGP